MRAKGVIYTFEVVARRAGSECDPVLAAAGRQGLDRDRGRRHPGLGKDARIEWKAPADGSYVVQIADLHDRGGEAFGYVLLAEAARPDFTLACDPDMINVGPGGRVPVFVRVTRRQGFTGAVTLELGGPSRGRHGEPADDLAVDDRRRDRVRRRPRTPSATARSSPSRGPATGRDGPIVRTATPLEEIYLPGGGRGHYPVDTLALAVTDPSDITVEATPREVVLAPGESAAWT